MDKSMNIMDTKNAGISDCMMEEPANKALEQSSESEFHSEQTLSCAVKDTVTSSSQVEDKSDIATPKIERHLACKTAAVQGQSKGIQVLTDTSGREPEQQASGVRKKSDNDSASENVIVEDITAADTISSCAYSNVKAGDLKQDKPAVAVKRSEPATLMPETGNSLISTTDITGSTLSKSSEKGIITGEQDKLILAAETNSSYKDEENIYESNSAVTNSEVQKGVELVIPVTSANPIPHQMSDHVMWKQLPPSKISCCDEVSHVCQKEVLPSKNFSSYIVVRNKNSESMQKGSKRSQGKLASLLQKLTAIKGGTVAPGGSTLEDSVTSTRLASLPTTTETMISHSCSVESTLVSCDSVRSILTEQAVSQHALKEIPSTTDNSPISFSQKPQNPVQHGSMLTFRLPSRTSSANKHHKKDIEISSKAQTLSALLNKASIPLKITRNNETLQSGSQMCRNKPTSWSLLQNKPPQAALKPAAHDFSMCGHLNESKQSITPADTSFLNVGQPSLWSAGKTKYVLSFDSVKGSGTSNDPLKVCKGQSPNVGHAHDSDKTPSSVPLTMAKSKHQVSLLQNASSKHPIPIQINTSASGRVTKAPHTYSLLANSPSTAVRVILPGNFTLEAAGVNIQATTPSLVPTVRLQDSSKASDIPGLGPDKWIIAPHNQLTNAGQVVFQQVPYAIVTSGDTVFSGANTLATSSLSKISTIKVSSAPSTSLTTSALTRTSNVIVMPTSTLATPLTTILAISTKPNSKKDVPPGFVTFSNITATSSQKKTMRTTTSLTKNPKLNTVIQSSADMWQNWTKLISNTALSSLSGTSTNRQATEVQSNLGQSLNVANQLHLTPKPAKTVTSLLRTIAPKDSGSDAAAHSMCLQTETDLIYKGDALTTAAVTLTKDMLTVSKTALTPVAGQTSASNVIVQAAVTTKRAQTSVTIPVTNRNNKHNSILLCPKPVKVTVSHPGDIQTVKQPPQTLQLVAPTMTKVVSLLSMPSARYIQSSMSPSDGSSAAAVSAAETYLSRKALSKALISTNSQLLTKSYLRGNPTENTSQNPSFKNVSAGANKSTHRKAKENAVYSAILRTGQGPVSVKVVAPYMDDDSSDTMSDTGMSLRLPEESVLDCEDAQGVALCVDDGFSDKFSDVEMTDLWNPEKLGTFGQDVQPTFTYIDDGLANKVSEPEYLKKSEISYQDVHGTSIYVDDEVSDTEKSDRTYSKDAGTSGHGVQYRATSLDDEETDSDPDMCSIEEQDMSVLRQLLVEAGSSDLSDDDKAMSSKQFQAEENLKPGTAYDTMNKKLQLEPDTAESTNVVFDGLSAANTENSLSSIAVSAQQIALASFTPSEQNGLDISDQTITKDEPEESECCGLKIESIFSLSDNDNFKDFECQIDNNAEPKLLVLPDKHPSVFNLQDSDNWKNFVSPCFVVLERLAKSEILTEESDKAPSKCSRHCRKRTLDYLCNLNLLTCVNHPDLSLFLKPNRRRIAVKKDRRKNSKHEEVSRENCVNEAMDKSSARCSPLLAYVRRGPSHKLHSKPSVCATILQASVESKIVPHQMEQSFLPVQDDQKADGKVPPYIEIISSGQDFKKFHTYLKQLRKQVDRKRIKMLSQKMIRKTREEPLVKGKNKLVVKKPLSKVVTKNLLVSTDIMKSDGASGAANVAVHSISENNSAGQFPPHTVSVAHSGVSHNISSQKNVTPPCVSKFNADKSGSSSASAGSRTEHISNLKTGIKFVKIQPQVQALPAEKVTAALQSLHSYLAVTGRKPTDGNSQYILLKIDDQHVLVKLPSISSSTSQPSNVTLSSVKTVSVTSSVDQSFQGNVNTQVIQETQSGADSNITKTLSFIKPTSAVAKTVSGMSTSTAKTVANMSGTVLITKSLPTSSIAITIPNISIITTSSTGNAVPNTTILASSMAGADPKTSVLVSSITETDPKTLILTSGKEKTGFNTAKNSFRIMKTAAAVTTGNTEKTFVETVSTKAKATASSTGPQLSNHQSKIHSTAEKHPVHISRLGGASAHPTVISLLRPDFFHQSQLSTTPMAPGYRKRSISSMATPHIEPNNVTMSPAVFDCSLKTSSGNSNIILSRLPPNRTLLPERRTTPSALSKTEREAKRRRLEAKYPLPAGVVIKSEPDDSEYEMSVNWPENAQASFGGSCPVVSTAHSLSRESLAVPSQQSANSDMDVLGVSVNLTSQPEESLSSASCENDDDSSNELDEPPPLIDETTSDDAGQSMQEDDITDFQEDMPPVLQPMFTSSFSSLVEDTDIGREKSPHLKSLSSYRTEQFTIGRDSCRTEGSTSATSLHSVGSLDSGIVTNTPSASSSYASLKDSGGPAAEKSICKNLKIQHLKELLRKKELEIENMKKMQSDFPSLDLDDI